MSLWAVASPSVPLCYTTQRNRHNGAQTMQLVQLVQLARMVRVHVGVYARHDDARAENDQGEPAPPQLCFALFVRVWAERDGARPTR